MVAEYATFVPAPAMRAGGVRADGDFRGLLLETDAPLPGGRHVTYGCPDCEDLACGAVTAVILRDGDDFVRRDFAWQTGEHADLEFNAHHGIGPYRFSGAEYRAALAALLDGSAHPRRRVLLIGADITQDARDVPADELRAYGAVAFGRAVTEEESPDSAGRPA